ncbi:MAG: LuxR C-terminal-related transcriptional regulator [Pseudoxanthomonas sp.]
MPRTITLLMPHAARPSRDAAVAEWMFEGKLEPPRQRANTVPRHALLDRLDAAARQLPLTLLLAPPGYGKTTLLAQWQQRLRACTDLDVAWLSLDEDDRDLGRLVAYLGTALIRAGVQPTPALQSLLQCRQPCDPPSAAAALIASLRHDDRRLALVLDDYDRAGSDEADALLARLVEHAGPQLHLLLATRRAPSLPLSRLAAQGLLQRLDAGELAFDNAEAAALLGADATTAGELCERTEGWAVALHLAALWAGADTDRQRQLARFSGRSAGIADYLAEQVVGQLPPALSEFLRQTALLGRFNAALADQVRERRDSGALLAQLAHFHGLLVPLDGEQEWFRYHPLFADYLRQQLERLQPDWPAPAHRRAAQWFAARGDLLEAVRHATAGGDAALAAGYIAQAGTWQLLLRHGPGQVRALLRGFDPASIRRLPALNLTQAYLHMKLGEFGHAQSLLAQFRDLPAEQREPFQRDYTVVVALLRDLLDEICHKPNGAAQIAAQAAVLDPDDGLGRGTLLCISATTALGRGAFADAERYAREGEAQMRGAGSEAGANYALLHLGQSHFYRGHLDAAAAVYRQALTLAGDQYGTDDVLLQVSRCLTARLHCEQDRIDEAADLLRSALAFIERHDGWFDIFVAAYESALLLAQRDDRSGRAANALLDRIDQFARQRRLSRLLELSHAWRLQLLLGHADPAAVGMLIADSGAEAAFAHGLERPQHWRYCSRLGFALAEWHVRCGRAGAALGMLQALEKACLARGDRHHLTRTQARIALVLQQRGQADAALPYLRDALDHVARNNGWLAILELGPPAKSLLRWLRQCDPESGAGTARGLAVQVLLEKLQQQDATVQGPFSPREREVLAQLAAGLSNKQIARHLHLSENTIKFHLKNLYRKFGANDRDTALAVAAQRGLVGPVPDRSQARSSAAPLPARRDQASNKR